MSRLHGEIISSKAKCQFSPMRYLFYVFSTTCFSTISNQLYIRVVRCVSIFYCFGSVKGWCALFHTKRSLKPKSSTKCSIRLPLNIRSIFQFTMFSSALNIQIILALLHNICISTKSWIKSKQIRETLIINWCKIL